MTAVADLTENMAKSLAEIPHPSLPAGSNIYGSTKVFPDYQASEGQAWFGVRSGGVFYPIILAAELENLA